MVLNIFLGVILCSGLLSDAFSIHGNVNSYILNNKNWKLNIVHTNDMHSRFEETSAMSAECSPREKAAKQCYGGFPRLATLIRRARNSQIPAIFLNAGDTYQGSAWFNEYKWEVVTKFLNILRPDVATLGNHEFDLGPQGLVPFLKNAAFPIAVCNLNFTEEPELAAINITKSIVLTVQGRKIGIIGYLTPETKIISNTEKVIFYDEIESIRKEVKKLQAEGVNILIGLGHSGYEVDKKIAAEVEGLDLIIGGHSHSFLYSGTKPDSEEPAGLYPTEIVQKSGRKVYVVQAYAFTKYLGNLFITFGAGGEIKEIVGRPILVDNSIEEAPDVLQELDKLKPGLQELTDRILGYTKVFLNGARSVCRRQECNMGNLITDAMVEYYQAEYAGDDGWTDAAIAIHNSGSVRSSISKRPSEPITYRDVLTVLPFGNVMGKTTITGKQLLKMLEHSAAEFQQDRNVQFTGQFLHFSGIQVAYDISQPVNSRAVMNGIYVRCAKCREPIYERLNLDKEYTVIMHNFIYDGGNGYTMFKENNSTWTSSGLPMDQVLAGYIAKIKYLIHMGTERRIKFVSWPERTYRRRRNYNIRKARRMKLRS